MYFVSTGLLQEEVTLEPYNRGNMKYTFKTGNRRRYYAYSNTGIACVFDSKGELDGDLYQNIDHYNAVMELYSAMVQMPIAPTYLLSMAMIMDMTTEEVRQTREIIKQMTVLANTIHERRRHHDRAQTNPTLPSLQ